MARRGWPEAEVKVEKPRAAAAAARGAPDPTSWTKTRWGLASRMRAGRPARSTCCRRLRVIIVRRVEGGGGGGRAGAGLGPLAGTSIRRLGHDSSKARSGRGRKMSPVHQGAASDSWGQRISSRVRSLNGGARPPPTRRQGQGRARGRGGGKGRRSGGGGRAGGRGPKGRGGGGRGRGSGGGGRVGGRSPKGRGGGGRGRGNRGSRKAAGLGPKGGPRDLGGRGAGTMRGGMGYPRSLASLTVFSLHKLEGGGGRGPVHGPVVVRQGRDGSRPLGRG